MKLSHTALIMFANSMTVKMLLPFQFSLLMHIYFWALTMLQIKQKITTTLLAWMVDYVEEDHGLQTIQQNFTAEQHGKGTVSVPISNQSAHSFCRLHLSSSHPFWKESGMQKAVVAKQVQKEPHCMDSR